MNHGDFTDGWGGGSWVWMALMMIAFWGGIIWLAVTLIRRSDHSIRPQNLQPQSTGFQASAPARPAPQEILAERLARGEIEPDDYRQRLDALRYQRDS